MNFLLEAATGGASAFFMALKDAFANFRLRDVIDILLLTVILFVAFRIFKGRKAGMLIIGISVCVIIYFVSG